MIVTELSGCTSSRQHTLCAPFQRYTRVTAEVWRGQRQGGFIRDFGILWSVFETYWAQQNAVQPVWLPALQSLATSFSTTARVAADAARQTNSAAEFQLWFDLVDSMLDKLLLVRQARSAARRPLMPLPGLFKPHNMYHLGLVWASLQVEM